MSEQNEETGGKVAASGSCRQFCDRSDASAADQDEAFPIADGHLTDRAA